MERALLVVALLFYLAPAVARDDGRLRLLAARWWVPAGMLLHLQGLVLTFFVDDIPLRSMTEGLGATSLGLLLVREWWGRRPRMGALRGILLWLAMILLGMAIVAPPPAGVALAASPFFIAHIALVLTGFAGLALSFSMSALYLVVQRRLKEKRLAEIGRLPSLDALDRLILRTMAFGFGALTAGMVVGFAWAASADVRLRPGDLTTVLSVGVWLWYATGLSVRLLSGWRGRLAAIFGLGGFVVLFLMVGLGIIVSGWHGLVS